MRIDEAPLAALSPAQHAALAAMDVSVYVRRRAPASGTPSAPGTSTPNPWTTEHWQAPIAVALARALRLRGESLRDWLQARGLQLPPPEQLSGAAGKRATWRLLRAHLRTPQ